MIMGQSVFSKHTMSHLWKEDEPDCLEPMKYDPHFGFKPKERGALVPVTATKEELDSANISVADRDECAHITLLERGCNRQWAPFWFMCSGLAQELRHCYFDSYIRDMKEFERERRLNKRERRIRESAQ